VPGYLAKVLPGEVYPENVGKIVLVNARMERRTQSVWWHCDEDCDLRRIRPEELPEGIPTREPVTVERV